MKVAKNILIVDDDIDQLEQMSLIVRNFGYNVILRNSQEEAEEYLKENKPDLAILDLMMEQEDSGAILAYRLKKNNTNIPVIIVTAVAGETGMLFSLEDKIYRKWIKADVFMEKNIRPEQLKREIERLLQN